MASRLNGFGLLGIMVLHAEAIDETFAAALFVRASQGRATNTDTIVVKFEDARSQCARIQVNVTRPVAAVYENNKRFHKHRLFPSAKNK